jgi:D-alanyl-D-alanine carboxypeptidase
MPNHPASHDWPVQSVRIGVKMMNLSKRPRRRHAQRALVAALVLLQGPLSASSFAAQKRHAAHAHAAMDVATGRVIEARDATRPWYPASVTKLMTVYVALNAVRQGRLTLDTPLVVSARAASMKPSKMGFAPGSQVTLDNALKMLMVKSANDLAVTIAEGVSGSVESFAAEMNQTASALGMRESHFVNPNGLPDPNHVSSARDMAILGRALLLAFPQHADLFNIGAMKLGEQVIPTHNGLIGRYPGADGMKTGFTCPAGFNLVASATREGRKVIVVVMGDSSARIRTAHAANLLDQAFAAQQLGEAASDLPSVGGGPPDMRGEICVRRSGKAQLDAETEDFGSAIQPAEGSAAPSPGNGALIASLPRPVYEPVPVYVGAAPGYQGPVAGPRPANTPIGAIAYAPPAEHAAAPQPIRHKAKPEAKVHEAKAHQAKAHEAKGNAHEAKVPAKAASKTGAKVSKASKAQSKTAAPKPPAKAVNKSASTSGKTGQN